MLGYIARALTSSVGKLSKGLWTGQEKVGKEVQVAEVGE